MADIITQVSSIVTGAIGWIGQYMTLITGNSLLMLFVCIPLVGLGIGLVRRLVHL